MAELWELSRGPGQPPKFTSPKEMWDLAVEYFKWCGEKVILEDKAYKMKDGPQSPDRIEHDYIVHNRPMTQKGLCVFLGISEQTYRNYREKDGFFEVASEIDSIMYEQKFTHAAVGMFNSNIIARDLGLADKSDITTNGKDINNDMSADELADKLDKLGIYIDD
jgi:hypothetical protein